MYSTIDIYHLLYAPLMEPFWIFNKWHFDRLPTIYKLVKRHVINIYQTISDMLIFGKRDFYTMLDVLPFNLSL